MDQLLRQLAGKLRHAYGEDLVSVVVYGSAADPAQHDSAFSDINVICVLREVTSAQLAKAGPVFAWWREQDKPAPLLLSEEEVRGSADCFPIEFHDIQMRRRILEGRDVFEGVNVDPRFYRAQVEYELRSKLLRLRQKAVFAMNDEGVLSRLLLDSVTTFCLLTKHALLLHGGTVPSDRLLVLRLAAERFGIDAGPFERLLDARQRKAAISGLQPKALFADYLKQISKVIDVVDKLENAGSRSAEGTV